MAIDRARGEVDHFRGCLLGGAIGDALGAPIEFMSIAEIREDFGDEGIKDFAPAYGHRGAITDDTQMTLFTAEGLLRARSRFMSKCICHVPSIVRSAYLRWLATQGEVIDSSEFRSATQSAENGWLLGVKELHVRRSPGSTCISALKDNRIGSLEVPLNDSKGCGAVMRMAPVGLVAGSPENAFELGCELGALTHGHPTGYLAAGAFSAIIACLRQGVTLIDSIEVALDLLKRGKNSAECLKLLQLSRALSSNEKASPETVERIGGGWTAGEALAIGVYAALAATGDFSNGVLLAVNHSGDSDSTGSIAGNILGMMAGERGIPPAWLENLELRDVISEAVKDLHTGFEKSEQWWRKYPGF